MTLLDDVEERFGVSATDGIQVVGLTRAASLVRSIRAWRWSSSRTRRPRRQRGVIARAAPHTASPPRRCCARSIRPTIPCIRSATASQATVRDITDDELGVGRALPARGRAARKRRQPVLTAVARRAPARARRLPVGSRAGPPVAAQVPARGDVRGLRRARAGFDAAARRGAGRPAAADHPARPIRGRGRASST